MKADGTPYVMFKGGVKEVKAMFGGVVIVTSKNSWMNEDLSKVWLQKWENSTLPHVS